MITSEPQLRLRGGRHLRLRPSRGVDDDPLALVRECCRASVALQKALGEAVSSARSARTDWGEIAEALGVSAAATTRREVLDARVEQQRFVWERFWPGRQSAVTATLLYFDGCPHWATMDRLRSALRLAGRPEAVERRKVETIEEAEALGFLGFPTILIDGETNSTTTQPERVFRAECTGPRKDLPGHPPSINLLEIL
jgi:hypothetical protein